MLNDLKVDSVKATCHCGNVSLLLPHSPTKVRHCNCSLCRRYGVLWTYYDSASVTIPDSTDLDSYAWGEKNVDFYRCRTCGCTTHWLPRDTNRNSIGVNARLLEQKLLDAAEVEYRDSANTGLFH